MILDAGSPGNVGQGAGHGRGVTLLSGSPPGLHVRFFLRLVGPLLGFVPGAARLRLSGNLLGASLGLRLALAFLLGGFPGIGTRQPPADADEERSWACARIWLAISSRAA